MSDNASQVKPYKGLMPYSEEDAPFFFGRDIERQTITSNLMASRLTLLYGGSGVGKSSILRAGVAHHLRRLARENLDESGTPQFAIAVFNEWRDDPMTALAACVREAVAKTLDGQPIEPVEPSLSLAETLEACAERVGGELYIILDQFEEYFLYHEHEDGEGTFATEFPRITNRPDLRVNSMIAIRDDAYAKLGRFQGRISNLFDNYLPVEHLSKESAREAIINPIERFNSLYAAGRQRISIEPDLVEAVLEQLQTGKVFLGEAGRGIVKVGDKTAIKTPQIETPFLQLVMTRLWDEEMQLGSPALRLSTLKDLGGAESIVQTHLDKTMDAMQKNEQEVASRIFYHLVTPSGTKIAQNIADLANYAKSPVEEVSQVVDRLYQSENRVLRPVPTPNRPDQLRCEIFHDVLAPAILDWRARYEQKQEQARAKSEMERKQQLAKKELEHERQRVKRLGYSVVLLGILLLVIIGLFVYARGARRTAERARTDADLQRTEAERQKAQAENTLEVVSLLDRALPFFKAIMRGHTGEVNSLALSPNGKLVATASTDNTARIWEVNSGASLIELRGHQAPVTSATFSPDGNLVVTASEDGTARVWETNTGRQLHILDGHAGHVNNALFSPKGNFIVTPSFDGTVGVWETGTGRSLAELRGHTGVVNSAAFSLDDKLLVTASVDGTARVWEVGTWQNIAELRGHAGGVNTAAFSPNGKLIVTASRDGKARVWEANSGKNLVELRGHEIGGVNSAAFNQDGRFIVTAGVDGTARVWQANTGRNLTVLRGHTDRVISAAFSHDGKRVISASEDKTARVWEISTARVLAELRGHTDRVIAAVFSLDDKLVITASGDKTARVWDTTYLRGPEVVEATLEANPPEYTGSCPVTTRFLGRISITGGSGKVSYRFVRSDGVLSRIRTLSFDGPGSKYVSTTWKVGPPSSGWQYLEILEPNTIDSKHANFAVECQPPPSK